MPGRVDARPSKTFFVSMLTRDIDLEDAILDLLDNCVDGILRQLRKEPERESSEKPYEGFWAKITASPELFSIVDNCGGISRDLAEESAFRLGRVDLTLDKDIPTVGMYGIGLKRALFKMGKYSAVVSRHEDDSYQVEITPDWLEDDGDWWLDLTEPKIDLGLDGTSITIGELRPNIALQFDKARSNFLTNLRSGISSLFSIIMKKGFRIYLNDIEIERAKLDVLSPKEFTRESGIQPYAYKANVDSVDIELVVGFYRELARDPEIERQTEGIPRRSENAGWTVICNDRVVLHRDKSQITGWGVRPVPKYHPQFISIAGIVRFTSNDSVKLPLNTTKRGLDTNVSVYWHALQYMNDGLKKFTDFTNKWKGRESETTAEFRQLVLVDATEIPSTIPEDAWRSVRRTDGAEQRFIPRLPMPPPTEEKRRIMYYRLKEEIEILGNFYFDDPEAEPADVGNRSFDDALERAGRPT